MAKPDQIIPLPDSGLPIEEEVKRNIEPLIEELRLKMRDEWDKEDMSEKYRDYICSLFREEFTERLGPLFEAKIEEGRGHEINQ